MVFCLLQTFRQRLLLMERTLVEIIREAARVNGKEVPEHLLKAADLFSAKTEADKAKAASAKKATILDLFRPKKMALRSVNMCFQWFSATMCYYGLSFASTSLSGDAFSNYLLSVFIEIPGCIFCNHVLLWIIICFNKSFW